MKKKYRLKKWVKVVITLTILITGLEIYFYLGKNGANMGKTILDSIFILLGWFWLVVGQIMALYVMWED